MNKHPKVRVLHVAANVATDTTTDPVECESPEPKTAFARIQGTGAITQTISLYGNVTESTDDGVQLASFTGKRSNKLLTIMVGSLIGGGGVGGAAAGYVAADVLASALMKPKARRLLTKIVTAKGGRAGQDAGAILAAGLSGALGNEPDEE